MPRLDRLGQPGHNGLMEVKGRVYKGVVVLDSELPVPDGTMVIVSYHAAPAEKPPQPGRRIQLPLVGSRRPGSLPLTAERVAELLEEEDVPS
jgi:hypothetical protein